jgi:hypothetical protein
MASGFVLQKLDLGFKNFDTVTTFIAETAAYENSKHSEPKVTTVRNF